MTERPCIPKVYSTEIREESVSTKFKAFTERKDIHQYTIQKIFPSLLPALEKMLLAAEKEKCFDRKYTKFRPLDYLTEYLYNHNPKYPERNNVKFPDIPFVRTWLNRHPRTPLSKFLIWSCEEAAIIIQAHFRGYLVRKQPEIQEFRQYQKELKAIIGKKQKEEVKTKTRLHSKFYVLLEEYLGPQMKNIYMNAAHDIETEFLDDTVKSYQEQLQKMYGFYFDMKSNMNVNIHRWNTACQSQMDWNQEEKDPSQGSQLAEEDN